MSIASKVIGLLKGVFGIQPIGSGGGLLLPISSNSAPSIATLSFPTDGIAFGGNGVIAIVSIGQYMMFLNRTSTRIVIRNDTKFGWSSGNADLAPDTTLVRAAVGVMGTSDSTWLQNTAGRVVLTADVTNDSSTLATTGLTVTLKAGRKYSFLAYLYVTTGAVLEGVQAGLAGTATITNLLADVEVKSHASTPIFTLGRLTAFGTAIGQTVADAGNVQVELSGTIECNAAGTFRIDFAKNADTGALLTTVKRGSWLLVEDVP